ADRRLRAGPGARPAGAEGRAEGDAAEPLDPGLRAEGSGGRVLQAGAAPGVDERRGVRGLSRLDRGAGAAVSHRGAGVPDARGDAGDDPARCRDISGGRVGIPLWGEVAGGGAPEGAEADDEDGCVEVPDGGWGAQGADDVRGGVQPGA